MHHPSSHHIITKDFLGRHMVRKKQESGTFVATVCMTLPIEAVLILDKIKKQHGNNRSAAAAHIIKDWKRGIDEGGRRGADEREKMAQILKDVLGK
jgi:hypothetical protein